MPVSVTYSAAAAVKELLDTEQHAHNQAIRLNLGPEGELTLSLDVAREGDQLVAYQGSTVLVIGPPVQQALSNVSIDVKETAEGVTLTKVKADEPRGMPPDEPDAPGQSTVTPTPAQPDQLDHNATRIGAALIDFIPLALLFVAMVAILGRIQNEGSSFKTNLGGWEAVHFLALALVYYVVLEGVTGTTLGKLTLGLKVIRLDGEPYGWRSVLIRNLLRVVDMLPAFYLLGIVSIRRTSLKQRLGDRVAGTQVVSALPIPTPPSDIDDVDVSAEPHDDLATDNRWKRSKVPGTVLAILVVGVISGLSIYLGHSSTAVATGPMPNDQELRTLATEALLDLDRAIQAKNFTSFYIGVAEQFRTQFTLSELEAAFQSFINDEGSFAGRDTAPVFDEPPAIDKQGLLKLSGYFPTTPLRVLFELSYAYEQSEWKLTGIVVQTVHYDA